MRASHLIPRRNQTRACQFACRVHAWLGHALAGAPAELLWVLSWRQWKVGIRGHKRLIARPAAR